MISAIIGAIGIKGILAALATAAAAIFAALWGRSQKQRGRAEADAEQMEKSLEAAEQKADLDRELVDADARRKLREKHYRD